MEETHINAERSVNDAQVARRRAEHNVYNRAERKRRKEARLARIKRAAAHGGVYVIEAIGLRKVKIGYATDVKRRMAGLVTGCPVPLRLVAFVKGPPSLEFSIQVKFFAAHSHNEWFKLSKRLAAFIEEHRVTPLPSLPRKTP